MIIVWQADFNALDAEKRAEYAAKEEADKQRFEEQREPPARHAAVR